MDATSARHAHGPRRAKLLDSLSFSPKALLARLRPASRAGEKPRRWPRFVAAAVALVALLYLTAINVFVGTRLFRSLASADPDSFRLDYASAYSVFPGRIHVEGLSIRGRDSSVEWTLTLDRCDFRVSFLDLFAHRFHAEHVRGDGLVLRLRRRLETVDAGVEALPPIPGFLDPPMSDLGPWEPALSDAKYNLWSVQLEDVVADHVREIWFDQIRATGDLTVRGRWKFKPLRQLEIGPATVEVRMADFSYGAVERLASGFSGSLSTTFRPIDVRDITGAEFLAHLALDTDLGGAVRADVIANRLGLPGLDVSQATAQVELRTRLDHGVLQPGTRIHSDTFDVGLHLGEARVAGRAQFDVTVDVPAVPPPGGTHASSGPRDLPGAVGRARVVASPLSVADGGGVAVHAASASVSIVRRDLAVVDLLSSEGARRGIVSIDVPDAELSRLAALGAKLPLPKGVSFATDRARASLKMDIDPDTLAASGRAELTAPRVNLDIGDDKLAGQVVVKVDARAHGATTELTGTEFSFSGEPPPDAKPGERGWWTAAQMTKGSVDVRGGLHLNALLAASARDASPFDAFIASTTPVPRWLAAAIPSDRLQVTCELRAAPSHLEVRSLQAHAEGSSFAFELKKDHDDQAWALLVQAGIVHAAVRIDATTTKVVLIEPQAWFEREVASIRAAGAPTP